MFFDDYPIVIWFVKKKKDRYFLLDSCMQVVLVRNENRKQEIYDYCKEIGVDVQNEF